VLGFTVREVAGTFGSTEEAVAMTLSRIRATLCEPFGLPRILPDDQMPMESPTRRP
jgi:hypothetical protein